MFFGKNKTSLRLSRPHPILVEGCEYHIVETVKNPTHVEVGVGISRLFLKDKDGAEFVVEGNATKIKELLIPVNIFENVEGPTFKLKFPVGSLQKNTLLKETKSVHPDEKIYLGHGVSERYFIQKGSNKVIKFIGNPSQIKNIVEEEKTIVPVIPTKIVTETPKVQIIEKVIIKETLPLSEQKELKGERGDIGPRGERGPAGPQGVPGPRGPMGPKGEQGEIGPQGPQGEKGEQGEIGPLGPIGAQGKQGPKGKDGKQGPVGPQGPIGAQGPVGPIGPMGPQGSQGIQGPKGDRGEQGIQGPKGERGPVGPQGPQGIQGPAGESSVLEAKFPLVLEEGVLSFNSEQISGVLEQLKNNDIQKAINQIALATPGGGGAVDVAVNGDKVIRSVNTMNFIGNNVSITRRRKNVDILIGTCGGGGADLSSLYAGSGININDGITFGSRVISNAVTVKSNKPGVVQLSDSGNTDLLSDNSFFIDLSSTDLNIPKSIILGSSGVIEFSDGSTQGTRPNIFTESSTAPTGSSILAGDRWFNIDDGKLYTAITDPGSTYPIWVQFGIGVASGSTASTPSGYTAFTNLSTDKTCDVNTASTVELANILGTLIQDLKTKGIISN